MEHSRGHRSDIDGLRAVAILGVLAYHFELPGVTGGFGGVDVFFVISGFLITGIIRSQLDAGHFSISQFYVRRIRRIVPALAFLAVVMTLGASLLMFPPDLREYGKSLLAVSTSTANYFFADKTGYFDGAAIGKPALHMWSLSVEEQFYVVFPILLSLLSTISPRAVVPVLVTLGVASFAYSVREVDLHPQRAFFQTSGRAWELIAGAVLAYGLVPPPRKRSLREGEAIIGGFMIGFGYFCYSDVIEFPGLAALPFCLGAMLIIHSGLDVQPTAVSRLLSKSGVRALGLISYSVYLWHWPLLALLHYRYPEVLDARQSNHVLGIILMVISLGAGALSWRFVEQPFRKSSEIKRTGPIFASAAFAVGALVVLSLCLIKRPDWFRTWPEGVAELTTMKSASMPCVRSKAEDGWPGEACYIGGREGDTLLWGDSHARALIAGFSAYSQQTGQRVIAVTNGGCPPLADVMLYGRSRSLNCQRLNSMVMASASAKDIHRIILAARWALYAEGSRRDEDGGAAIHLTRGDISENASVFSRLLEATVKTLVSPDREVVIIGPIPEQTFNVTAALARHRAWGQPLPRECTLNEFLIRQRHVLPVLARLSQLPNVRVIYPHRVLCDGTKCHYSGVNGMPLYRDSNHLNDVGAVALSSMFAEIIKPLSLTRGVRIPNDAGPTGLAN